MLSTTLLSLVTLTSCTYLPDAWVDIVPGGDQISGRLELFRHELGVVITGTVNGLTEGKHGFHVHEKGDLGNGCKAAGGHFNPFKRNHGGPTADERHVGDLGNIEAGHDGEAHISISDRFISLDPNSEAYIGGLAIVIHAGVDDLGLGGNEDSLKTGNAGSRSGCGIININHRSIRVHQQPQLVHQQPQLVHQQPQPVYRQPQPVHQLPQPVYRQPQPVHQLPQPVYRQPQPVHQLPQPVPSYYRPVFPPRLH